MARRSISLTRPVALAAAALLAACQPTPSVPSTLAPSALPSLSSAATIPAASPSGQGSLPVEHPASVLARIALPGNENQAPFEGEFAVAGGAIWIERPESGALLRVDAATEQITATIRLPYPIALIVGDDGSLWDVGPYGGAPGPEHFTLSRIDLKTGIRTAVVDLHSAQIAVGLGAIWVSAVDGLDRLDLSGGPVRRVVEEEVGDLEVACGLVWGTQDLGLGPVLHVFDPATGSVFAYAAGGPIYEQSGECWYFADAGWSRIWPSGAGPFGRPAHVQYDGTSFWRSPVAFLERWDPMTGKFAGERWVLDAQDTVVTSKNGLDGKLIALDGDLWLINAYEVVRLDIAAGRA